MSNAAVIKRGSSALLILFVVFVFVLCSLFLILYGAHVYSNIQNRVEDDFEHRMSISYITNKLRACDVQGGVTVEESGTVLRLCSEPDDVFPLYTYIYYFDGYIMEYVTQDIGLFEPEDGEIIMEVDSLIIVSVVGGLRININASQEIISYTVSLKSA